MTILYVVGDACAAGWSPNDALEMTKVGDGQFTWTGELLDKTGDRRFKFLVGRGWDPCLAPQSRCARSRSCYSGCSCKVV